jgi:GNAT superfamily N-acetyltransferase
VLIFVEAWSAMTISRGIDPIASRGPVRWRFSPTVKLVRPLVRSDGSTAGRPVGRAPTSRLDLRELDRLDPRFGAGPQTVRERTEAGDACFGIRDGSGCLASIAWVVSGRCFYIAEIGAEVWVPFGTAYIYDVRTLPERRGHGLMTALLRRMAAVLESAVPSKNRCEAWTMTRNHPSVRAFQRAGFTIQESFVFASVGSIRLSTGRPWLRDGWL